MKILALIIILSTQATVFAENYFVFDHPTCVIKIKKPSKSNLFIHDYYKELLAKKGLKTQYLIEDRKLLTGELYAILKISRLKGKLWKDCVAKISLKKAKTNYISTKDPELYSKESKRSLPRVTFSGNERCTRALRDAFVHIPYCQKSR